MARKKAEQFTPVRPESFAPDEVDRSIEFRSDAECRFAQLWATLYPDIDLVYEYRYAYPSTKTVDFTHLKSRVCIEINGGIWSKMGHSTGQGITRDYHKITEALKLGWRIIPITVADSENAEKLAEIADIINQSSTD